MRRMGSCVARQFLPASISGLMNARYYGALKYSMYDVIDFSLFFINKGFNK